MFCHSSEVKYTSQIIAVKQEILPMNKSQAHLPMFLSDWLSYAFITRVAITITEWQTSRMLNEVGLGLIFFFF